MFKKKKRELMAKYTFWIYNNVFGSLLWGSWEMIEPNVIYTYMGCVYTISCSNKIQWYFLYLPILSSIQKYVISYVQMIYGFFSHHYIIFITWLLNIFIINKIATVESYVYSIFLSYDKLRLQVSEKNNWILL